MRIRYHSTFNRGREVIITLSHTEAVAIALALFQSRSDYQIADKHIREFATELKTVLDRNTNHVTHNN